MRGERFATGRRQESARPSKPRVFVSYAHEDADLVQLLGQHLRAFRDLDVFIDTQRLEPGAEFTPEIKRWAGKSDLALLVVSNAFLTSEYIQNIELPELKKYHEVLPWILAQACNWQEYPLLANRVALHELGEGGRGALGNQDLPERTITVTSIAKSIAERARELSANGRGGDLDRRSTPATPGLETDELISIRSDAAPVRNLAATRVALCEDIVRRLTDGVGERAAQPIALLGPGGVGKSDLALSVANDPAVRSTFDDGIYSIYVGADADLTDMTLNVLRRLGIDRRPEGESEAFRTLRSIVASRNILLIFDDVLDGATAKVLALRGNETRILFTGRRSEVFTGTADVVEVQPLTRDDILAILSADGRTPPVDHNLDTITRATAGRLHHLQLVLRDYDATHSWDETARRLERAVPMGADGEVALLGPLHVAYERLSGTDEHRFERLAIFPQSHRITLEQARRAWGASADDAEETLQELERAALIERPDPSCIVLPKTNHEFAATKLDVGALAHRQFLDSVPGAQDPAFDWSDLDQADTYMQDHLVWHLGRANDRGALIDLARNVRWLARRIHHGGAAAAASDLASIAQFTKEPAPDRLAVAVRQRSDIFLGLPDEASVRATLAYLLPDECAACGIEDFGEEAHLVRSVASPPRPSDLLRDTYAGPWDTMVAVEVVRDTGLAATATGDGFMRLWWIDNVELHAERQFGPAEMTALAVHKNVVAVAITDGGDHRIALWDVAQQSERERLERTHDRRITCLALGPNGRRLASASTDGTVKLWNTKTGRQVLHALRLTSPDPADASRHVTGWSCRFSPDGALLAVAGSDGLVRLWETSKGRLEREYRASTCALNALDIAPDGKSLVTVDASGDVRTWALHDGSMLASASTGGAPVLCCRYSPDGQLIATGGQTGVQLWQADSLEALHHIVLGPTGAVFGCAFSDDSTLLATATHDGKVRVWDLQDLEDIRRTPLVPAGQLTDCDIDPEDEVVLTARSSGEVELMAGREDTMITSVKLSDEPLAACAYAPAEPTIVTLTESGALQVVERTTLTVKAEVTSASDQLHPLRTSETRDVLSFSPSGDAVAVVGAEPLAVLERAGTEWVRQDLVHAWAAGAQNARTGSTCAAFVGDGSVLFVGYADGRVSLVRRSDGEVLASQNVHDDGIVSCVVDHDKGELISACRDGTLVLWRADDLTLTGYIHSGHEGDLTGLSMTERYIYTVGDDGTLRLASRSDGTSVVTLGLGEPAVAVACHQPLIVAITRMHVHRFLEI